MPETEKDSLCQVEGHRFVAFNQARNDGLGSVVSKPSVAREVNGSSDKLLHRCLGVNFMLSACHDVFYKYTVGYLLTKYAVSCKRLCLETVCRENKMEMESSE